MRHSQRHRGTGRVLSCCRAGGTKHPPPPYRQLKERAAGHRRSLNSHVIAYLLMKGDPPEAEAKRVQKSDDAIQRR